VRISGVWQQARQAKRGEEAYSAIQRKLLQEREVLSERILGTEAITRHLIEKAKQAGVEIKQPPAATEEPPKE